MTENQLIKEFNQLRKDALISSNISGREYLNKLSNHKLFIYIAGKTYEYGRSFKDSIENAGIHLKNKKRAIKIYSSKSEDLFN